MMKMLVRNASVGSSSSAASATPRNRQLRRLPDGSRRNRPNASFCYQHVHAGHDGANSSVHAIRPPQLAASFVTDPFLHSSIL